TTAALAQLQNTALTIQDLPAAVSSSRNVAFVGGVGSTDGQTMAQASLHGGLIEASAGSALAIAGSLGRVFANGVLRTNASAAPVASIDGGTHTIGTGIAAVAAVHLNGRTAASAQETQEGVNLTLGTDQPLQHGGTLVEVKGGATVTTGTAAVAGSGRIVFV